MSLAVDTHETVNFSLVTDMGKPEQERPAFLLRFLSCRDYKKVAKLFADVDGAKDVETLVDTGLAAIRMMVVGWVNMPLPYSPDALEDIITQQDIVDFKLRGLEAISASELDKKKQALRSLTSTDKSVKAAVEPPVGNA